METSSNAEDSIPFHDARDDGRLGAAEANDGAVMSQGDGSGVAVNQKGSRRRPRNVWLDLATALCLGIGVWTMWPLAADNSSIDKPMGAWGDVPWLVTVSFVAGWGLGIAQSLFAMRPLGIRSAVVRGLSFSLALWVLLFLFAVPFHWTFAFAMSMHFIAVILVTIVMGVWMTKKGSR